MFAFLSFLFVLIVIFLFTSTMSEGFAPVTKKDDLSSKIPSVAPLLPESAEPVAHELPGEIPTAPYQQLAATSPLPYQDTSMIKANRQQIVSLLEMLKGFLGFEAQELADKSDPSIQLPLTTARSDHQVLQSAAEVMDRNPGVQSNITLSHLNEITSNLAYLQEHARLTGSAGAIQEGFETKSAGQPATKDDLTAFVSRIQGEILRLSASGTTDPIVTARVGALTKMKGDIQAIVDQVNQGTLLELEIPVMKNDLDRAFPILGKPSEALPQLIHAAKLPAGLANALPSNIQKDPETTRQIGQLLDKYADQIMRGISATFQVSYQPQPTADQHAAASTLTKTGFPSAMDLDNVSNAHFMPMAPTEGVTDRLAPTPMEAGRGPSHFDWKQRAKEIEGQVAKRGLTATDFGIMPKGTKVSDDFSWKGYARMICTRLQATTDPALPQTCGCPPLDWAGWRIAK